MDNSVKSAGTSLAKAALEQTRLKQSTEGTGAKTLLETNAKPAIPLDDPTRIKTDMPGAKPKTDTGLGGTETPPVPAMASLKLSAMTAFAVAKTTETPGGKTPELPRVGSGTESGIKLGRDSMLPKTPEIAKPGQGQEVAKPGQGQEVTKPGQGMEVAGPSLDDILSLLAGPAKKGG